jgi:SagB-type dehydrogenase family enzyme
MKAYLNPHLFFIVQDGETVAWDYKNHNQYVITEEHYKRLKMLSSAEGELKENAVDRELLETGLISTTPYPPEEWKWDILGKMYHVGSQNTHGDIVTNETFWVQEYQNFCRNIGMPSAHLPIRLEGERVFLPKTEVNLNYKPLEEALLNRATTRNFNGNPISLKDLSRLLYTAFGPIHGPWTELREAGIEITGTRRAYPSGGGLHPIEGYAVIFNVKGVPPGIYHYDTQDHALTYIKGPVTYKALSTLLCGQFFVEGVAFGLFLVGYLEKVWHKYGHSRSYKDVYLEAGHVSQTLLLSATNLGLLTWVSAWFSDKAVSDLLNIDGLKSFPMFFQGFGYGEKRALPKNMINLLEKNS